MKINQNLNTLTLAPSPCPQPCPQPQPRPKKNGFSLIELLATLSVIMLTLAIGVSGLSQWLQYQTESSLFRSLTHLATFARTRAIKDNQYLTLCPSADKTSCNGPWNKTIIVFNDSNTNERVDNGDVLYRVLSLPETTPCLLWQASLGRHYLQFKPSGASNGTAGHFRLCDAIHNSNNKKLVIGLSGRTSLRRF